MPLEIWVVTLEYSRRDIGYKRNEFSIINNTVLGSEISISFFWERY